eukprot:Gb_07988 [translate_table: standard]
MDTGNLSSFSSKSSSEEERALMEKIQVVVVPFPAQGHLNQLLHLSRTLATRGLSVLFVTTSTHINQVRHRVQGWDPENLDFRFEELPMPDFTDIQPDIESTRKFPTHLIPLFEASEHLQRPFDHLIYNLIYTGSNKNGHVDGRGALRRIVVVHDPLCGWVQTVAAKYGVPAYVFRCIGAYASMVFHRHYGKGIALHAGVSLKRCLPENFIQFSSRQAGLLRLAKGQLMNSFKDLESGFISELRDEQKEIYGEKPLWAIGPLLPEAFCTGTPIAPINETEAECLRWLDSQAPASVLYVSFGTMASISPQQIRELALGLEDSQQHFLWVLKVADTAFFSADPKTDWLCELLPEGYEDRMRGRCLITRNWAPQLHILSHKSTGGFLTHCGWNSTLEGISLGVPMIAWPLHSDQFSNAIFVARELKVGVEVKKWTNEEEDELVKAEEVERAVRRVMVDSEGYDMRKRASELKAEAWKAIAEGGSSCKEMDSFIHHFTTTLDTMDQLENK